MAVALTTPGIGAAGAVSGVEGVSLQVSGSISATTGLGGAASVPGALAGHAAASSSISVAPLLQASFGSSAAAISFLTGTASRVRFVSALPVTAAGSVAPPVAIGAWEAAGVSSGASQLVATALVAMAASGNVRSASSLEGVAKLPLALRLFMELVFRDGQAALFYRDGTTSVDFRDGGAVLRHRDGEAGLTFRDDLAVVKLRE